MLPWGTRTFVMGIVNVTPDSFSGDGTLDVGSAVKQGLTQHRAGADIIDIGGESSRPGAVTIADTIEIERIVPVVRGLREHLPDAIISIDTYKPSVARAAHMAGATLINSVWGAPPELLTYVAKAAMPIVIMHNRQSPLPGMDSVDEIEEFLHNAAQRAMTAGVAAENIILDPGIGFGKTHEQNIAALANLHRFVELGFPTLLGTSRKSTLGCLTGRAEPKDRVAATTATTALAIAAGIDIVRVHDVAEARDAVAVSDAVIRGWRPAAWIA